MAKNAITLADLNTALKPLIEAINRLREDNVASNTQTSEIHAMVTNISVKLDTIDQTTQKTLDEAGKSAPKKAATRKPVGKKAATKKAPARRGKKADAEEADADAEEPAADDAEDAAEEPAIDDADDADDAAEDDSESKKPSKKKAPPKKASKAPAKKPTKASAKKPSAPRVNKMTIFKDQYKKDETSFDKWLTAKVKKEIAEENAESWGKASGDALVAKKASAYYAYMNANHADVVDNLKKTHTAEEADDDGETSE